MRSLIEMIYAVLFTVGYVVIVATGIGTVLGWFGLVPPLYALILAALILVAFTKLGGETA